MHESSFCGLCLSHPHLAEWLKSLFSKICHPPLCDSQRRGLSGPYSLPREAWGFSLLFTDRQHLWEKVGDSIRQTDGWLDTHVPLCHSCIHLPSPTHTLSLKGRIANAHACWWSSNLHLLFKACILLRRKAWWVNSGWLSACLTVNSWINRQDPPQMTMLSSREGQHWVTGRADRTEGQQLNWHRNEQDSPRNYTSMPF